MSRLLIPKSNPENREFSIPGLYHPDAMVSTIASPPLLKNSGESSALNLVSYLLPWNSEWGLLAKGELP
jgi:hypothetical protein